MSFLQYFSAEGRAEIAAKKQFNAENTLLLNEAEQAKVLLEQIEAIQVEKNKEITETAFNKEDLLPSTLSEENMPFFFVMLMQLIQKIAVFLNRYQIKADMETSVGLEALFDALVTLEEKNETDFTIIKGFVQQAVNIRKQFEAFAFQKLTNPEYIHELSQKLTTQIEQLDARINNVKAYKNEMFQSFHYMPLTDKYIAQPSINNTKTLETTLQLKPITEYDRTLADLRKQVVQTVQKCFKQTVNLMIEELEYEKEQKVLQNYKNLLAALWNIGSFQNKIIRQHTEIKEMTEINPTNIKRVLELAQAIEKTAIFDEQDYSHSKVVINAPVDEKNAYKVPVFEQKMEEALAFFEERKPQVVQIKNQAKDILKKKNTLKKLIKKWNDVNNFEITEAFLSEIEPIKSFVMGKGKVSKEKVFQICDFLINLKNMKEGLLYFKENQEFFLTIFPELKEKLQELDIKKEYIIKYDSIFKELTEFVTKYPLILEQQKIKDIKKNWEAKTKELTQKINNITEDKLGAGAIYKETLEHNRKDISYLIAILVQINKYYNVQIFGQQISEVEYSSYITLYKNTLYTISLSFDDLFAHVKETNTQLSNIDDRLNMQFKINEIHDQNYFPCYEKDITDFMKTSELLPFGTNKKVKIAGNEAFWARKLITMQDYAKNRQILVLPKD